MKHTLDVASETELRDLFSMEADDGDLGDLIATCAGEWRYDGNGVWRFWEYEGHEGPVLVAAKAEEAGS